MEKQKTEDLSVPLPAAYSSQGHRGAGVYTSRHQARGRNLGHPSITGLAHHPVRILRRTFICAKSSQDLSGRTRNGPTLGAEPRRTVGVQSDGAPEELWEPGSFRPRCFSLLSERPMFYFSSHLKDLSVTLIRGGTDARQCFLSIPRPPLTPATIYWGENGYFCRGKGCRTSQLMPVNYLSPESNTFSWCQNYGRGELGSHAHSNTHTHTPTCTLAKTQSGI